MLNLTLTFIVLISIIATCVSLNTPFKLVQKYSSTLIGINTFLCAFLSYSYIISNFHSTDWISNSVRYELVFTNVINVECAFSINSLKVIMLIVVNLMLYLIYVYSLAYMAYDKKKFKFFAYLSLFTLFMILLITGDNLVILFLAHKRDVILGILLGWFILIYIILISVGFCTLLTFWTAKFYIFYVKIELKLWVWYINLKLFDRLTYVQNDPLSLAALAACAVIILTGVGYFVDTTVQINTVDASLEWHKNKLTEVAPISAEDMLLELERQERNGTIGQNNLKRIVNRTRDFEITAIKDKNRKFYICGGFITSIAVAITTYFCASRGIEIPLNEIFKK